MTKIQVENKEVFQVALARRLAREDNSEVLKRFGEHYFAEVPIAELRLKDWDYAVGSLTSCWDFFETFAGKTPRVRVFNPTQKSHGYRSNYTVVEVICQNLPFLLDSIRLELNHRGLLLADVQQCMLPVIRRPGHDPVITDNEQPNELVLHLEVAKAGNTAELQKAVREIVRTVQRVVTDCIFRPIVNTQSGCS